jgi:hypothetical protein
MDLEIEEIEREETRIAKGIIAVFTVVSLYVITFATMFYDPVNTAVYPLYNVLSNIFGGSIYTLVIYTFIAIKWKMPAYSNWAAFGVFLYVVMNLAYSVMEMTVPNFKPDDIYPFFEKWATGVCSILCTYSYVKHYINTYDERIA